METQYTVRHFLDTIVNANLLLKDHINRMEQDILSFDEFISANKLSKTSPIFPDSYVPKADISKID